MKFLAISLFLLLISCSQDIPVNKAVVNRIIKSDSICPIVNWTPEDGSVAALRYTIDTAIASGWNATYCQEGPWIHFQFVITFPVNSDTNQAKIKLPVIGSGYDVPVSIGACLGSTSSFCSRGGWATVTPGNFIKFFAVGGTSAATNSLMSGVSISVSGIYRAAI